MEAIGVKDDGQKLAVLRAIDKLDKFGIEGVLQLLGAGRKDESGDFTKGAGLGENAIRLLTSCISPATPENPEEGGAAIDGIAPDANALFVAGMQEVTGLRELLQAAGYTDRIRIDPSVVRGLEYYTGPVFECELTFEVPNEKGEIVRFGSVAGGGRYDGLVKRFTGQDVPATGFSIGVSRLMAALKNLGKLDGAGLPAPVLVTVMDRDALGSYQKLTQQLRAAGIRAEMYQGNPKNFGNQLKYADRRGCPIAVIQGSQEREAGKLQLKDLIEGRRQAEAIASNAEWRAARPGQFEIAEQDLVAETRKLLKAQAGG
jgi:histidyl-tRNA synthetase